MALPLGLLAAAACAPASALAAPTLDGERDAEYTLVASTPRDNLLVNASATPPINDPADARSRSLDVAGLYAANSETDLYLYIELPYLDLSAIAGEWAVAFHLRGANDALQRAGTVTDPYGASVDFAHTPACNAMLKSNMRGYLADYDGNQGYAFLIAPNKARTDWDWENGNFLASSGWTTDSANGLIRGTGSSGAGIVYKGGKGIEARIPLALFAVNSGATDLTAPVMGDEILLQFYDNVRERGTPRYPRGPIDCAPFEASSRANPARGAVSQWASYTLSAPPKLDVTSLELRSTMDLTHLLVAFSSALGEGATTAANYQLSGGADGAPIPVSSVQVDPSDAKRAIVTAALPFNTRVRVTVSGVKGANGAVVSPGASWAELTLGVPVEFSLFDPYGAVSSLGTDPSTGLPYKVTLTGDMTGWAASPSGAGEAPVDAVPGEPGHYRTPPVFASPGVVAYKYRVPGLPNWDNANALNPNNRRFFVPAASAIVEAADNAAGSVGSAHHYGGAVHVTWTLVDRDNAVSGRPVYLTGQITNWSSSVSGAIPMAAVAGQPNVYRAAFDLPVGYGKDTTTTYKYILKPDASTTVWNDLNPLGDRWAIFRSAPGEQTAAVTDVLSGAPRYARMLRAAAGLDPTPMYSDYYSDLDEDRNGGVTLTDVAAVLRAERGDVLPRLKAQGTKIVDSSGKEVLLRGINLGGWLVEEMWMTPWVQDPPSGSSYQRVEDHVTLWATLNQRLGAAAAQSVKAAYRNAWLQESDFPRIRAAGLNCVRLPFIYDIVDEPGGMDWLRNAVAWANAAGLYVILDMHGAPGSQNPWDHSGRVGLNSFFSDPNNITKAEQVWTALAVEFGGRAGVAAFDLLNEPAGAPDAGTLHQVHNRLYQAIRKAAPATLVIVEDGYKGFDTIPPPALYGWTNVVYSTHIYDFEAQSTQDHLNQLNGMLPGLLQTRADRGVPVYIGEFNLEPNNSPQAMSQYVKTLTDNGLAWSLWTYKTVASGGPMGFWGYYSNASAVTPLNPFLDSTATLVSKLTQVRTANLAIPSGYAAVFLTGQ
jgi:hypothetical protein